MAGSKSSYLEKKLLDHVLGNVPYTPPATVYVALSTAAWSETATGNAFTEAALGRVAVTNNATSFPAATSANPSEKKNASVITFAAATADIGAVYSWYILDAATNGNVLWGGDLTQSRVVATGDLVSFPINGLTIKEY